MSKSGKLYSVSNGTLVKWPIIPAKPVIKPIIQVICFGDDGAFIILIYGVKNNKWTEMTQMPLSLKEAYKS